MNYSDLQYVLCDKPINVTYHLTSSEKFMLFEKIFTLIDSHSQRSIDVMVYDSNGNMLMRREL